MALIVVLAVLVLAMIGVVAYLVVRTGGGTGGSTAPAAVPASSAAGSASAPRESPETVTVTVEEDAPRPTAAPVPSPGTGYPAGADRSGWTDNRQARCNAGDPAAMIGRTTQASFSICVNPDNGRYYYRGSADGLGVEIDDPVVSGSSATVYNNDVVYSISPSAMVIYQGGSLLSSQTMVQFWAG